jgi:hypothetical protein
MFSRHSLAPGLLMAAISLSSQLNELSASCQSSIVSSTVVATFCGHRQDENEMLDLLIVWRGSPGWFQNRHFGGGGGGGSRKFGAGTKGYVAMQQAYGDVTISFDADFDANTVAIGERTVALGRVNTIVVDKVDQPGVHRISAIRRTEPRLPLGGDVNLFLAQHSRRLLNDLHCEIPMPTPPSRIPQAPVLTVCEKLKQR